MGRGRGRATTMRGGDEDPILQPRPTPLPSLPITQNWWVPRLNSVFGCVSSFCSPHELKSLLPALTFTQITILHLHACSAWFELNQPAQPCHDHAVLHAPTKPISLTSFSAFFTEIRRYYLHLSCLYIWFIGNRVVFRIFYIESRTGVEVCFFVFFFIWCLGFRIWFVLFRLVVMKFLHLLHLGFQTHVNLQNQATHGDGSRFFMLIGAASSQRRRSRHQYTLERWMKRP